MIKNVIYQEDLKMINNIDVPWENFKGKAVLITGATGLIGSVLAEALIYRNEYYNAGMDIWLLGRSKSRFESRYGESLERNYLHTIIQDVAEPIHIDAPIDYIIHGAGKGDPASFEKDPVGIMNANYMGMYRVLELAKINQVSKVLYISSGEVYGIVNNIETDGQGFVENDYGYLDILLPRACYASSKRAAETLCISYIKQFGINVSIARPCHIFGASMLDTDSRVIGEFIHSVLFKKNIIMKSQGIQRRSYCYVADAVTALIFLLLKGICGEAYNIANKNASITIRQLAELSAGLAKTSVIYDTPSEDEKKNSSNINHAVLNPDKMERLGWKPYYGLQDGFERTISILRD
jgi:UDP-glucuronate decarboxylase